MTQLDGTQTTVLLQGCEPEQITSLEGQFSDIRVTRKWFDGVQEGQVISLHQSTDKPETPSEYTYPKVGDKIADCIVIKKALYPTMEKTIAASTANHFVQAGNTLEDLENLLYEIYPSTALDRAEEEPLDGFTVLTLQLA